MGLTFFVATAGLVVAGYFGYRKLQNIEAEIREEIRTRDEAQESESEGEKTEKLTSAAKTENPPSVKDASDEELAVLVLKKVRQSPGILQTEVYDVFSDRDKKDLQALLLKMDREGRVRREKKGSTYQLFPA